MISFQASGSPARIREIKSDSELLVDINIPEYYTLVLLSAYRGLN